MHLRVLPAFLLAVLSACSIGHTSFQTQAITLTSDGAWCWFSDPRAIRFTGAHDRTYAAWVDSSGNIVAGFYDHRLKKIQTSIVHRDFQKDDHNNPALLAGRDGHLSLFYSKHATTEPIVVAKTVNPEDISSWEITQQLDLNDSANYPGMSDTYTYANICRLANEQNKLYLFWRGTDFKPNASLSHDGGDKWDAGRIFILPERSYRDRRPYLKVSSNNHDVIHFAFTDGHPAAEPTNSIYYISYKNGALWNAAGQKIMDWSQLPIAPEACDIVYNANATGEKAWIWDVAESAKGEPVVVYSRFRNDSTHVYYYGIFYDGKWNNHELVNSGSWFPHTPAGARETEPYYSGGIAINHEDASTVFLSREVNGVFEIEKWSTTDKGKTWTSAAITRNSRHDNVRPFVAGGSVLWMKLEKYIHWTDYRTSVLLLPNN